MCVCILPTFKFVIPICRNRFIWVIQRQSLSDAETKCMCSQVILSSFLRDNLIPLRRSPQRFIAYLLLINSYKFVIPIVVIGLFGSFIASLCPTQRQNVCVRSHLSSLLRDNLIPLQRSPQRFIAYLLLINLEQETALILMVAYVPLFSQARFEYGG
jgi:hypothetical protein